METNNINKDLSWLKMCEAGAGIMAKCSKAQYFSYVIDAQGRVRGCGYNGTPPGLLDCISGGCPRAKNNVPSGTPYNYGEGLCLSNHAEMNAILGIDRNILQNSTLYVNAVCCFGCAKEIVGVGIKRVVGIAANQPLDGDITKRLFEEAGVEWILVEPFEDASWLKMDYMPGVEYGPVFRFLDRLFTWPERRKSP